MILLMCMAIHCLRFRKWVPTGDDRSKFALWARNVCVAAKRKLKFPRSMLNKKFPVGILCIIFLKKIVILVISFQRKNITDSIGAEFTPMKMFV